MDSFFFAPLFSTEDVRFQKMAQNAGLKRSTAERYRENFCEIRPVIISGLESSFSRQSPMFRERVHH
jgi:hypothetical protein